MTATQRAMTLRLSEEQAAALEYVADVDGVSVSDSIRTAIENHIESRKSDDEFQQRLAASMKRHQKILDRLAG